MQGQPQRPLHPNARTFTDGHGQLRAVRQTQAPTVAHTVRQILQVDPTLQAKIQVAKQFGVKIPTFTDASGTLRQRHVTPPASMQPPPTRQQVLRREWGGHPNAHTYMDPYGMSRPTSYYQRRWGFQQG